MSRYVATETRSEVQDTFALLVRWIVTIHASALLMQLGAAVAFVAGWSSAFALHSRNAWVVGACGLAQLVSILMLAAKRASRSLRAIALAVVLAEAAQIYYGAAAGRAMHVTMAMLIWAFSLALAIQVWAPTWKRPA